LLLRLLVGGIQLLLVLLLLLLQLLHLLHQLLGSLRTILLLPVALRTWITLLESLLLESRRLPARHDGTAESTRLRWRRLLRVLILILRSVGDGNTFVPGIIHLRRLRIVVLRSVHSCCGLARSQDDLLDSSGISGDSQDDVIEFRAVQQRVQHIAREAGAELAHYPIIAGGRGNVDGSTCPRLYCMQNLGQRGIGSLNRELAVL